MKRLKLFLATLGVILALTPAVGVFADTNVFNEACKHSSTRNSAACEGNSGNNPLIGPDGTITKVTAFISYLTGIAVIIMLIIGGFMYVSSGGDAGKVASARETILYAVIGLVIVLFAQALIIFVLNRI